MLLEGVPKGIDLAQVQQALTSHPGVEDVHDLHVWALASSTPALTAHIVVNEATDRDRLRDALATLLHDRFDIVHVTCRWKAATAAPSLAAHQSPLQTLAMTRIMGTVMRMGTPIINLWWEQVGGASN